MTRTQRLRDFISGPLTRSKFYTLRSLGWAIGLKAHETFYGYTTGDQA